MKDDEGHRAIVTEQGASASQMAAARSLDTIFELLQVKISMFSLLLRPSKKGCPPIWIRLPLRQRPNRRDSITDAVVPIERHLYKHPLACHLREKQFAEVSVQDGWENVLSWDCLCAHTKSLNMASRRFFPRRFVDEVRKTWMADLHEAGKMAERLALCAAIAVQDCDADVASEAMRTYESHKAMMEYGSNSYAPFRKARLHGVPLPPKPPKKQRRKRERVAAAGPGRDTILDT